MLHPTGDSSVSEKVTYKSLQCVYGGHQFGHFNTKDRPENICIYAVYEKPVGDVMHIYRRMLLTPNMADALPTLRKLTPRQRGHAQWIFYFQSLRKVIYKLNSMHFLCSSTIATSRVYYNEVRFLLLCVCVSFLTDRERKTMLSDMRK